MIAVKAMYDKGQITLLEKIYFPRKAKVIVTVLEEEITENEIDSALFDDLVGAVNMCEDGSIHHDTYIPEVIPYVI